MSTCSVELLAIGHASYDLTLFVDEFPRENSKLETYEMLEHGGGPAANAAYLLSLWGVNCGFAGLVGNDLYGQRVSDELRSAGVDLSLTEIRPSHVTPLSVILVNTCNGSRTIVNRKEMNAALQLHESQLEQADPRLLLFDGHEPEASHLALHALPGAVSILDAGSLRTGTEELAGKVSYLVASEHFALQATGLANLADQETQRKCLRQLRGRARADARLVVTLGERGLIYEEAGAFCHLPAFPVHPVDTTGAGDTFHGAFAFGILRGLSLHETLRLASMAAALSVQRRGGRPSIPALAEVQKELAQCSTTQL